VGDVWHVVRRIVPFERHARGDWVGLEIQSAIGSRTPSGTPLKNSFPNKVHVCRGGTMQRVDTIPDDFLRPFLAGRDVACPQCDYNLRDLSGDRCPECGQKIQLRLGLAEPRQRLLIAGLVGLSAGAGMSGLLLLYLMIRTFIDGHTGGDEWTKFLWINLAGFVIESLAVWAWLGRWRTIRTWPLRARAWSAATCWCLSLANVVVFAISFK
jgi:hypothetical protein